MLSSFSINQLMTEGGNLRERILLEEVPSGQFFLPTIIEAMSKGKAMELDYKKFSDSEPYTCFIEPYCVKLSQQRWYLLARKNHSSHLQLFALDRMQQLRILEDVDFQIPEYFSPIILVSIPLSVRLSRPSRSRLISFGAVTSVRFHFILPSTRLRPTPTIVSSNMNLLLLPT